MSSSISHEPVPELTFDMLSKAVAGRAAAIRCRSVLQPAAGEGTKVFPPTHLGGAYAMEQRRLPGCDQTVQCVLLDSVQSQANRIEEALQDAVDRGLIELPLFVVNFGNEVADIQRVTSLQAPHRAADAILRDSLLSDVPFRKSKIGEAITDCSLSNATALFSFCPHALVLGVWDSTGPKGGLGAKFARAMVSEVVGIGAQLGKKTSSRIDPLQTRAEAKVVKNKDGSWKMAKDNTAKDAISPAEINHGNIPPDISDGGVTIKRAEHTAVLSLAQLRRLRFPLDGKLDQKRDDAARTTLAALALAGLTLAADRGFDLRSRCLLFPDDPMRFELLETPGNPTPFSLGSDTAISILKESVEAARKLGLLWSGKPVELKPSPQLIELIKRSQAISITVGGGGEQ
jgi:CRISPR-associated protein Csb1